MSKRKQQALQRSRKVLILSLILFALSATVASSRQLFYGEEAVFLFVYRLPAWLSVPAYFVTLFGSSFAYAVTLALLVWFKRTQTALAVFLAGGLAFSLAILAKTAINRGRPIDFIEAINSRELFVSGPGFPSGHTAMATALALTILPLLHRKYRWLAAVWIIGVAISRLYLGVHLPVDLVGGFALGVISAYTVKLVLQVASAKNKKTAR